MNAQCNSEELPEIDFDCSTLSSLGLSISLLLWSLTELFFHSLFSYELNVYVFLISNIRQWNLVTMGSLESVQPDLWRRITNASTFLQLGITELLGEQFPVTALWDHRVPR